jgi:hypothetical protein
LLRLPLRVQAAVRTQAGRNLFVGVHVGTLAKSLRQELASTVPPWAFAAGVWRPKNAAIRNRSMALELVERHVIGSPP